MFNVEMKNSHLSDSDTEIHAVDIQPESNRISARAQTRRSLIEYDESEGVSDISFASDSCTSKIARAKFRMTSPNQLPRSFSLRKIESEARRSSSPNEDVVLHAGSSALGSIETAEQESAVPSQRLSDVIKLEEICAKLRHRVNELESVDFECNKLRENLLDKTEENKTLRNSISNRETLLTKYAIELNNMKCREHQEKGVEANIDCVHTERMHALESQAERGLRSAQEAERLGEQVSRLLEEKDSLRRELKKIRNSQSSLRIKTVLKENEILKESHLKNDSPVSDMDEERREKLTRVEDQWQRRLEALRAQHESVCEDYEKTILSLTQGRARRKHRELDNGPASPPPQVEIMEDSVIKENQVIKLRVKELENRIESVKQYYTLKLRKLQLPVDPPIKKTNRHRSIRKYSGFSIPSTTLQSDFTDTDRPPVPDTIDVSVSEWIDLLRACMQARNREDLATELIEADYRKHSLIEKRTFVRALGQNVNKHIAATLCDIYAFSEDQIDYKTFLSDLATRCGLYSVDLEVENSILRKHVNLLMNELKERIETVEIESHLLRDDDTMIPRLKDLKKNNSDRVHKSTSVRGLVKYS